jgi:hypothetical protein
MTRATDDGATSVDSDMDEYIGKRAIDDDDDFFDRDAKDDSGKSRWAPILLLP